MAARNRTTDSLPALRKLSTPSPRETGDDCADPFFPAGYLAMTAGTSSRESDLQGQDHHHRSCDVRKDLHDVGQIGNAGKGVTLRTRASYLVPSPRGRRSAGCAMGSSPIILRDHPRTLEKRGRCGFKKWYSRKHHHQHRRCRQQRLPGYR